MELSPRHLRRAWPFVVVTLLAIAAYFQASGISMLMAAALAPTALSLPSGRPARAAPRTQHELPSARSILSRNPFDSETGPLDGRQPKEPAPVRPARPANPLAVPKCQNLRVDATTESTDPLWSMAVVQHTSEPHGRVRRVGQTVAGMTIAYVGYNPREQSPAVWLATEDGLCQSLLFDEDKLQKPAPATPKQPPKPGPKRPSAGPPPLPKQISDKIKKIGASEFEVDRSVVDVIVSDYSKLMRGSVVKPAMEGGRVAGLRLERSTPASLLGRLGLLNGDIVRSINGFPLASPEKALEAYARLRTASEIRIAITRGGKPVMVDLHIR